MKYRFRRSDKQKSPFSISSVATLQFKGRNTLRLKKERALTATPLNDFGAFEEDKSDFSLYLIIRQWIRKIRSKKKREPRLSLSFLLGALCSSLSISIISGLLVVLCLLGGYGGAYTNVVIPDLVSLEAGQATKVSTDIFEYTIVYEENPQYEEGAVISQSPRQGITRKLYGSKDRIGITLTVNKAGDRFTLPQLIGKKLSDTLLLLKNFGINVAVIEEYSSTVPFDTVFFSSLSEGTLLSKGDSITIKSSLGKEPIFCSVPDLYGLSESQATAELTSLGLAVGDIRYESSALPIGTVISQQTALGTALRPGSKVSFTVSGGIYYTP